MAVDRYDKGETITIYYFSRGHTTELTDVKITIYDKDGNTTLANDQTMTEVGTTGVYQYQVTAPNYGLTYVAVMDSVTKPYKQSYQFHIAPIRKVLPGAVGVVGVWTIEEKEKLLKEIERLFKRIKEVDKFDEVENRMDQINRLILIIEQKLIKIKDKINSEAELDKRRSELSYSKSDNIMLEINKIRNDIEIHGKALTKLMSAEQLEEVYNEQNNNS